jgi:uncharacterized protein YoxC
VAQAAQRFASDCVEFRSGTAEDLLQVVEGRSFDLIVSLETIEHVDDPVKFLENIRHLASRNKATIVISAPNDHWYYAEGGDNEFHKRRYTFEEFRALTESVLGAARSWSLGTLGFGFSINNMEGSLKSGHAGTPQDLMLDFKPIEAGVFVPSQIESDVTPAEAAFYVGVWGAEPIADSVFAGYPVSMNLGRRALFPTDGIWAIKPDPQVAAGQKHAKVHSILVLEEQVDLLTRARAQLTTQVNALLQSLVTEGAKATEQAAQIAALDAALSEANDKLKSSQREIDSLGMAHRATRAEVQVALRRIWRLQEEAKELHAPLADLQYRELDWTERLNDATHQLQIAEARIASMPWRVIRIWWGIRKFIPNFVLRAIGNTIHMIRGRHVL